MDLKFTKPCTVEDAIRYLHIPDDAAAWILQSANFDPDFPRRFLYGQAHVVPLQLARFLIMRGVGYLLEGGPLEHLLEDEDFDVAEQGGDNEEDDQDDDASEDEEEEPDDDDGRPPKRPRRRR